MQKKCLECTHPGKDCIPHLMTMPGADLLAWCRDRKDILRLSNADIAARSNVPKGTIDRLFSSDNTDFRFSTIQPIICVLTGCEPEELDCTEPSAVPSPDPQLVLQVHDLQKDLQFSEKLITRLEDSVKACRMALYGMMALCAVLAVSLVGYLRMDANNTDIGFIRENYTSPGILLPVLGVVAACVAAVVLIMNRLKSSKEKQ